jgi:two-component system, cell cycle response regulator
MDGPSPPAARRILLLGFGSFERHALASYLRLSGSRSPAYAQAESIAEADYVIADADHPGAIDQVMAADRLADTVFIGSLAPEAALGWAMRPIDPLQVFREIDAAVALRESAPTSAPVPLAPTNSGPGALDGPLRRAGDVVAPPLALIVDDSEIALRFLQRQLEALGLRTESATNSTRALQLLSQQRFGAVFLDVDLGPGSEMDGLTLCQHLKRSHRPPGTGLPPKVVMVSAHAAPTDRVRGTLAGCDAYLSKPLDDEALRARLRQLGLIADEPPKRKSRQRRADEPAAPADSGSVPRR